MSDIIPYQSEFISPVADSAMVTARYQAVKDFIRSVLREGVDYGKIPGAGDKPTLLKPGAEKMCAFFGLTPRIVECEKVEDWTGKDHDGEPFFYYRYRIGLYRGSSLVAEGEGSANSWEKKYRYRNGERVCPSCGKANIRKSKQKPGDNRPAGWYCWEKTGGCGATFTAGDKSVEDQIVGQVKNPDVADIVNTLQKMAQKRALMAPVLVATNTSDYFTQDIEDFYAAEWHEVRREPEPDTKEILRYQDGEEVSEKAIPSYVSYVEAHGGKAPANVHNLRNWYKSRNESSAVTVDGTPMDQVDADATVDTEHD